jgi:hypothetical protein
MIVKIPVPWQGVLIGRHSCLYIVKITGNFGISIGNAAQVVVKAHSDG